MAANVEVEIRFRVPAAARKALAAELARGASTFARRRLSAVYLDTDDRRLARAGIGWRLRTEGRGWTQTLKAGGTGLLARFEHEVARPGPVHDPDAHAHTPVGKRLLALLRKAHADGARVGVRYRTEVTRSIRRVRTRGAIVEIAFDEGRLLAGEARQRIREVEFELVSGSEVAMLALVQRWRRRFDLQLEPRSKAERGDRLAQGAPFPPVRKSARPAYPESAGAVEALAAALAECLAQITLNATGIAEGDPALTAEHVHQLRIGIRRLRCALRSFRGWTPAPPAEIVAALRALFADLGRAREIDVLESGVLADLAAAGAPPLSSCATMASKPDARATVRASAAQDTILQWIAWRSSIVAGPASPPEPMHTAHPAPRFAARLQRWHRRIAADAKDFDALDEAALHALRKRVKRQRYAVEFFAPALRARAVARYLEPLAALQDRMGELNDLFVARRGFQSMATCDPAVWFALGWLAARIAQAGALSKTALERLAKADPPRA